MGRGDSFAFCGYKSDDTKTYSLKLSAAEAAQGGLSSLVSPKSVPPWPYGAENIRHVRGLVPLTGQSGVLKCQSNTFGKYTSGGTFTLGGVTYTIQSLFGERQPANHIG